ncbi:hypothetical protein [Magnetospirillum molischianum]|uniref:Protein kinase domain-containing protein n=1 Tax=Magnetospirillum molischianum DSM 120 TaxID=1150626 RepID=H8FY25_MAGML|nr:hypothetical protein [Magnetospirillum molischianum]CCG43263.1 conserved hypothetical protein [Magnetospirillum molischianum DSM 120]
MTSVKLPETVQHEFNDLLLGDKLGSGCYRDVYELAINPRLVMKIEIRDSRQFCNVCEWEVWNELRGTEWEKFLAPCRWISHSGSVLIQERTEPITKLPTQLPSFMTDIKLSNLGKIGRRVVAHDYAFHKFFTRGLKGVKMAPVPRD